MFEIIDYTQPNVTQEQILLVVSLYISLGTIALVAMMLHIFKKKILHHWALATFVVLLGATSFLPIMVQSIFTDIIYPKQLILLQTVEEGNSPTIYLDAYIEHIEKLNYDSINEIQLPLNHRSEAEAYPPVALSIIDHTNNSEQVLLYEKTYTTQEYQIPNSTTAQFLFPELSGLKGKKIGFRFATPEATEDVGLVLSKTEQDHNPEAQLVVDGSMYGYTIVDFELVIAVFGPR